MHITYQISNSIEMLDVEDFEKYSVYAPGPY